MHWPIAHSMIGLSTLLTRLCFSLRHPSACWSVKSARQPGRSCLRGMEVLERDFARRAMGASSVRIEGLVQNLWSGYGSIVRLSLTYPPSVDGPATVVLKHVSPPATPTHARGWASDAALERKLRSYVVETEFYKNESYAKQLKDCRVPGLFAAEHRLGNESFLLLEDLDAAGFSRRSGPATAGHKPAPGGATLQDTCACVMWLARFHAQFLTSSTNTFRGLWEVGTYWHLATRPDELAAMPPDSRLRKAAQKIDATLRACKWQTILHGDAKMANFCFPKAGVSVGDEQVAAVDFQYCGRGCGMQDLAYLIGSSCLESELEERANDLIDSYFRELKVRIEGKLNASDWQQLEAEWRSIYPWAVADFERFLMGWAPNHWKLNAYSARLTQHVLTMCEEMM